MPVTFSYLRGDVTLVDAVTVYLLWIFFFFSMCVCLLYHHWTNKVHSDSAYIGKILHQPRVQKILD